MSSGDLARLSAFINATVTTTRPSNPTKVTVDFVILKTLQLSSSGVLDITGALYLFWNTSQIFWDPRNYGNLSVASVLTSSIWTPSIILTNSASADFTVSPSTSSTTAYVSHEGYLIYYVPKRLTCTCSLDLTNFPFDKQTCKLQFLTLESISEGVPAVNFTIDALIYTVFMAMYDKTGEFSLQNGSFSSSNGTPGICLSKSNCYATMNITLNYVRRSSYYIWNLIVPGFLLTVTVPFVFLLPSDNGAKVSMACSLMVALYVLQQNVSRMLPASVVSSLCSIASICSLIIGCLAVMVAIVVVTVRVQQPLIAAHNVSRLLKLRAYLTGAGRQRVVPDRSESESESKLSDAHITQDAARADQKFDRAHKGDKVFEVRCATQLGTDELTQGGQLGGQVLTQAVLKIADTLEKHSKAMQADADRVRKNTEQTECWKVVDLVVNIVFFVCFLTAALVLMLFFNLQVGAY